MIRFVNAKINIGLQIVRRREDGYHDLQSVFYPVGLHAGLPDNPIEFCDLLEIVPTESEKGGFSFSSSGRSVDCAPEKNLVVRAASKYLELYPECGVHFGIHLEKHLPDGAGMGGGSADAAFTLEMLTSIHDELHRKGVASLPPSPQKLHQLALSLGADCPFFLMNKPAYVEGIGEKLMPLELSLTGMWLAVVKPAVSISTKEAFAGINPRTPDFDLRLLPSLPIKQWKDCVKNDFEDSIFPKYPILAQIKDKFYSSGALYSSLTGSGSCIYAFFESYESAALSLTQFSSLPTIEASYLLKI